MKILHFAQEAVSFMPEYELLKIFRYFGGMNIVRGKLLNKIWLAHLDILMLKFTINIERFTCVERANL